MDDTLKPDPTRPRRVTLREAPLDVLFGVLSLLLAIIMWIGADYIERGSGTLVGPAGFPKGVSLILGFSSLLLTLRGVLALRSGSRGDEVAIDQPVAVLISMVLIVVYPILLARFGYYTVTGPWLVALLFASGNRKIPQIIGYAVGFLIFTKLVFELLIGVPLP
jgi:hypothetical protein